MQNGPMFEIGISMTIEETRLLPNLISDYLEMAPGSTYDVQLAATEISRIESPYTSKCKRDYPVICKMPGAYSMPRCSQGCVNYQVQTACNCTPSSMMEGDLEQEYNRTIFCGTEQFHCIMNHWETLGKSGIEEKMIKPCTPECHRVQYSVLTLADSNLKKV